MSQEGRMRLDKWLWAARFFKTRSLAGEQLDAGKVTVNGIKAKRATAVAPGDEISLHMGGAPCTVILVALSAQRGPASVAQQLYRETIESATNRAELAELRKIAPDPERSRRGRPTKQDRRRLQSLQRS